MRFRLFLFFCLMSISSFALDFVAPLDLYTVTSDFGVRKSVLGGNEDNYHKGIDMISSVKNAQVKAAADGIVTVHYPPPNGRFKGHPVFGGMIVLVHEDKATGLQIYTLYGHMKTTWVREGQTVKKGEPMGIIGNTGQSTGTHLHFEIMIDPIFMLTNWNKSASVEDELFKFFKWKGN